MRLSDMNRSESLFDSIGDIDDRFVSEAESFVKARQAIIRTRRVKFASLVAAAAAIAIAIIPLFSKNLFSPPNSGEPGLNNNAVNVETVLSQVREEEFLQLVSGDEIDYLDNTAKLIWQYEGDEDYVVLELSEPDKKGLTEAMKTHGSTYGVDETAGCYVWISLGNGTVVSPYLLDSPGNVGISAFEYMPEVEPSDSFVTLLSSIISRAY